MKTKEEESIQEQFVKVLKGMVPAGISIADDLADLLQVSTDSAYRRLRNETDFTLEEIYAICKKYRISIDSVFSYKSDTVTCNYTTLSGSEENLEKYLGGLFKQLKTVNDFEEKKIIYAAEEMPIMHSFFHPELAAFKLFYWQRSVLNLQEYQGKKFSFDMIPPKLMQLAHDIHLEYMSIPGIEIWTDTTIQTVLKQVEFYYESGAFTNKEDALKVLDHVKVLAERLSGFAEKESKQNVGSRSGSMFQLYNSDLVIGTNCIHVSAGDTITAYISFNTMNSLRTSNHVFCNEIDSWMKNLLKKSSLISGSAEKQRFQFFKNMHKQIDVSIDKVKTC